MLTDVAAFNTGVVNYTGGAFPEQLRSGRVSADFFKLFGAPVLKGPHVQRAEEDVPGGDKVVVLSHQVWTRRFDSDPDIIGKTISLSGDPYVVIGVLARASTSGSSARPRGLDRRSSSIPNTHRSGPLLPGRRGRLKPGVTLEQAQTRDAGVGRGLPRKFPTALQPERHASRVAADPRRARRERPLVAAGAGRRGQLRAADRVRQRRQPAARRARPAGAREIAIRAAIGGRAAASSGSCSPRACVLSPASAACSGSLLGVGGIRALLAVNTAGLPRVGDDGALVGVDWRVAAVHARRVARSPASSSG